MKTCPQCNTGNRPDAKFCVRCGHHFVAAPTPPSAVPGFRQCPACGGSNDATAVFCINCGAALPQGAAPGAPVQAAPAAPAQPAPVATTPAPAQPAPVAATPAPAQPALATPAPQPAAAAVTPASSSPQPAVLPSAAPVDGHTCAACGAVVRFCPSCGAPLVKAADGQLVHSASVATA